MVVNELTKRLRWRALQERLRAFSRSLLLHNSPYLVSAEVLDTPLLLREKAVEILKKSRKTFLQGWQSLETHHRFTDLAIGQSNNRSSHRRCSVKKGALKYFANFTGKHMCQSLYLIKLQAAANTGRFRLWYTDFVRIYFGRPNYLTNTSSGCFIPVLQCSQLFRGICRTI